MSAHDMSAHDMPDQAMSAPLGSPAPTDSLPAPHTCDCLGHCCATAVALPALSSTTVTVEAVRVRPLPMVARTSYVAIRVDFVLPFAIAPPVSDRT
jgi:hypothetical protein